MHYAACKPPIKSRHASIAPACQGRQARHLWLPCVLQQVEVQTPFSIHVDGFGIREPLLAAPGCLCAWGAVVCSCLTSRAQHTSATWSKGPCAAMQGCIAHPMAVQDRSGAGRQRDDITIVHSNSGFDRATTKGRLHRVYATSAAVITVRHDVWLAYCILLFCV